MLDAAAGKLGATVTKAVEALGSLLSSETPTAVRMASAKALAEFAFRTREVSLEKRLAELEARTSIGAVIGQHQVHVAGRDYDELVAEITSEAASVTKRLGATTMVLGRARMAASLS